MFKHINLVKKKHKNEIYVLFLIFFYCPQSLMINKKEVNLFSFTANFGSEESCRLHFKEERDKIGVQCKSRNKEYFWIKNRWSSECNTKDKYNVVQRLLWRQGKRMNFIFCAARH